MNYRMLGKTGLLVSELALGCEYVWHSTEKEVTDLVHAALDSGVNYIDIFIGTAQTREYFGNAIKGRRKDVIIAGHLGGTEKNGQYNNSRDMAEVNRFIEELYEKLQTDYLDIVFLHNCDSEEDRKRIFEGEMYQKALSLKKEGKARFIGLSSHNTKVALDAVKDGKIDVLMFPINPLFNLMPRDRGFNKMFDINADERVTKEDLENYPTKQELYDECKKQNVGLVAMKPFAGGNLLKEHKGGALQGIISLTPVQCISYILSQTGVSCALPGFKNTDELKAALAYFDAKEEERDFTIIERSRLYSFKNRCMYCNHCQPCPKNIDIAKVSELSDLAEQELTENIKEQYYNMTARAKDCIACGACVKRCPFAVDVIKNMERAKAIFKE